MAKSKLPNLSIDSLRKYVIRLKTGPILYIYTEKKLPIYLAYFT